MCGATAHARNKRVGHPCFIRSTIIRSSQTVVIGSGSREINVLTVSQFLGESRVFSFCFLLVFFFVSSASSIRIRSEGEKLSRFCSLIICRYDTCIGTDMFTFAVVGYRSCTRIYLSASTACFFFFFPVMG